jgi:hypothetical protein
MLIVRFTEILVLFVLLINLLFHRPWLESFLSPSPRHCGVRSIRSSGKL